MNKREQGAHYRIEALRLLSAMGYATTRQIAKGIWGRCDTSTRKMAGRTLRCLQNHRLIVSKRDGKGINKVNHELLFALTAYGAEQAKRHNSPLVAQKVHARDYLRHAHDHRTACNCVYVAWPTIDIWSELEVNTGECPLSIFKYCVAGVEYAKIPDLVASGDREHYEWIEVENSWRSDKDLSKIVDCLRAMFRDKSSRITQVHFVVTAEAAKTIYKRLTAKMTHGPDSGWSSTLRALDARILSQHIKVWLLDPKTLTLHAYSS